MKKPHVYQPESGEANKHDPSVDLVFRGFKYHKLWYYKRSIEIRGGKIIEVPFETFGKNKQKALKELQYTLDVYRFEEITKKEYEELCDKIEKQGIRLDTIL